MNENMDTALLSFDNQPEINTEAVKLPAEPEGFRRVEDIPPQTRFSGKTRNLILVPVRAELRNGNLYNFLHQLNEQKNLEENKLGVVFCVNEKEADREEIKDENNLMIEYLLSVMNKDFANVQRMDIPENYKKLAEELVDRNVVEIRIDHLKSELSDTHFGRLRLHELNLAQIFKSSQVKYEDVILHPSDVDVTYPLHHFRQLIYFYTNPMHCVNFCNEEFLPGVHEGNKFVDISSELLKYLDEVRLWKGRETAFTDIISDRIMGTPLVSMRMLELLNGDTLNPQVVKNLNDLKYNEDFWLANFLDQQELKKGSEQAHLAVGNIGEVYRLNRARSIDGQDAEPRTDAEEVFSLVESIINSRSDSIKHPSYENNYFADGVGGVEKQIYTSFNRIHEASGVIQDFRELEEYRIMLLKERRLEKAKVRLRKIRLFRFINSLNGIRNLSETEEKIIEPYENYFQGETRTIREMLKDGKTAAEIVKYYSEKYSTFFDPNHTIHNQMARINALKRFVFAHPEVRG